MKSRVVIERNTLVKRWDRAELKICLCSPTPYEVSVLSLALQIIYGMWNLREDVLCERAFPNVYNGIYSLETKHKLSEFDVLAFSLQYETDLINVLNILRKNKIPLLSCERGREHPVLIAGGPLIMQNPRPFSEIFDVLFIGELEELSNEFLDSLKSSVEKGSIDSIIGLPCVYTSKFKEKRVKRCYVKNLNTCFYPTTQFYPEGIKIAFGPSFLLEISRGCSYNCKFCLARSIYRPLRIRSLKRVKEILDEGLKNTNLDIVSIISFAAADHPELVEILETIVSRGLKFTLPSVRIDKVPFDVLKLLRKIKQKSITIAPEVGSERLASAIGKEIYPEEVTKLAKELYEIGFRKIKMYFMIGFPEESEKDVAEIPKLIENLVSIGFSRINVSINPLIPKPHTPLQWSPFIEMKEFKKKKKIIIEGIKHRGIVRLSFLKWREGVIQTIIARGNERVGMRLVKAERDSFLNKRRAYFELLKCLAKDKRPLFGFSLDDALPWEVVDVGIRKKFLIKEFEDYCSNLF